MKKTVAIAFCLAVTWTSGGGKLSAQPTLTDNQKAVLAFDIRVKRLIDAPVMQSEQAKQATEGVTSQSGLPGVSPQQIVRIFGAASAPESLQQLMAMEMEPGGKLPLEFFIRVVLADEASADAFFQQMEDDSESIQRDGSTYIRPPNNDPENMYAHRLDKTTIEFGTDNYLFRPDRKVFSDGLQNAWNKVPDHAIRYAIDLEGRRDFVNELVGMAKSQAPPMMGGFIDLINKATELRMSMDLVEDPMFSLSATGVDESQAEELRAGLDAVLGMAKMSGQQMMPRITEQDPESAKVLGAVLESLTATRQASEVRVNIARPEGFDEAVTRMMAQMSVAADQTDDLNRFRQYAISVHNYHDVRNSFPSFTDDDAPQLSWRVKVLPYLEEMRLYDQMNMEENWDSAQNKPFATQMPAIFGDGGASTDVCFIKLERQPKSFADVIDGTSNTIMLMQNPKGVPWTQPIDLTADQAVQLVMGLDDGASLVVALYDGSVRRIDNSIDEQTLRNLLDARDGNPVGDY